MLGIMMTTMFLSMWVSNTGATVMILPIVEVLIRELFKVSTACFKSDEILSKSWSTFRATLPSRPVVNLV